MDIKQHPSSPRTFDSTGSLAALGVASYAVSIIISLFLAPWFQIALALAFIAHLFTSLSLLRRKLRSRFDRFWISVGILPLFIILGLAAWVIWGSSYHSSQYRLERDTFERSLKAP